jgi:hypothetical protein
MTITPLSPSPLPRLSRADTTLATATLRQRSLSAPPSTAKTQITHCDITVSIAPAALKTTVAALAQPPFPFESEKSHHTPALISIA